jgi:chitinase
MICKQLLSLLINFPLLLKICDASPDYKAVGYYSSWKRDLFPAEKVDFKNLTHIAHAFIWPNADGSLSTYDNFLYHELINKTHQAGRKILVSIGGWGHCDNFSPMTANVTARTKFVDNVKNFCSKNGYDGADIDWEYPQSGVDLANLNRLIQEFRAAFDTVDSTMILSMAVPVGDWSGKWFDFATLKNYVNWIGGMTYDFHGTWTDHAGHSAPLYAPPNEAEGSVDLGIQYLLSRGIPAEKICLGLPFYGKEFTAKELYGSSTACNDLGYNEIIPRLSASWIYHWDNLSKVPYLTNSNNTKLISFDDTVSVRIKCEYVKQKKLGGVIIWELSQDDMGDSQPLLEVTGSTLEVINVPVNESEVPKTYVLENNYPNPFNSSTTIRYYVFQKATIRLEVFNILGEKISILMDQEQEIGWQRIIFEAKEFPSGIYFYQLSAPSYSNKGKMILIR